MQEAKAMTYSCWQMYERQPTGLSPEYVEYRDLADPVPGKRVSARRYLLVCRTMRDVGDTSTPVWA